jgi:hypothetical protein
MPQASVAPPRKAVSCNPLLGGGVALTVAEALRAKCRIENPGKQGNPADKPRKNQGEVETRADALDERRPSDHERSHEDRKQRNQGWPALIDSGCRFGNANPEKDAGRQEGHKRQGYGRELE